MSAILFSILRKAAFRLASGKPLTLDQMVELDAHGIDIDALELRFFR